MNTSQLSDDLQRAASSWQAPAPDVVTIRARAEPGRRRTRTLALAGSLGVIVLGCVAVLATFLRAETAAPIPRAGSVGSAGTHLSGSGSGVMAPARPPSAAITAVNSTGRRTGGELILAHTTVGTPVTIRAQLSFRIGVPGRVRNTAIVVTRPGTAPVAAPDGTGSYYRATRVAISPLIDAKSPQRRLLSVTAPSDLPAGAYPVLSVIRTVLVAGQTPGVNGPFQATSELGVIIVAPN